MTRNLVLSTSFILLILFVGCNGNIKVSGKVQFPDGKTLERGEVVFQSKNHIAKGLIDKSGYFTIGGTKKGNGVPPDFYAVYIMGAVEQDTMFVPPNDAPDMKRYLSLVASPFTSAQTTPLHFKIDKRTHIDIFVEYP
jgi:hypothetical protein